jgi:hypothetical protein
MHKNAWPDVRPGQIWMDGDPRKSIINGKNLFRTLQVEGLSYGIGPNGVEGCYARCYVYIGGEPTGKMTSINIERFKPGTRGYCRLNPHMMPEMVDISSAGTELACMARDLETATVSDLSYKCGILADAGNKYIDLIVKMKGPYYD